MTLMGWNDTKSGAEVSNGDAALTLSNGHPKSGIPEKSYRAGRVIDPTTSGKPIAGIGVGGAIPIGAFQS